MKKILLSFALAFAALSLGANTYDSINEYAIEQMMSSISVGTETGPDHAAVETATTDQNLREKLWENDEQGMLSAISDQKDRGGLTLLMIASAFGDSDTVRYLLNAKTNIENSTLVNIKGIDKDPVKDKDFYGATRYFVEDQKKNGVMIRAKSTFGYTALTYAVVGGHYDVVVTLVETLKELMGKEEAKKLINKKDNNLWSSIMYAVSYNSKVTDAESFNRLKIVKYLVTNGADTRVKGSNFYEGELDLICIAAKYAHPEIIDYFFTVYKTFKTVSLYTSLENAFGSTKEIQESLSKASKIALKYAQKNINDKMLFKRYGLVIDNLAKWEKIMGYTEAYSHYRLSAGGTNLDEPYGVYNLKLNYTIDCDGVINDVKISDSPITTDVNNKDKFKIKTVVRYYNRTSAEEAKYSLPDYYPVSPKEAYVFIIWSYANDRPIEPSFFGPDDGNYTDRDGGTSVIYINASSPHSPTSEVVKASGNWRYSAEFSGLSKITN